MTRIVAALIVLVLAAPGLVAQEAEPRPVDLVVHEWGTFTTLTRGDGVMLEWRPLEAPQDLPDFVHDAYGQNKFEFVGTMRMETPVIYFHAKEAMTVDVRVDFEKGQVTEWYPKASGRNALGEYIVWNNVEILPGADLKLPGGDQKGHYFAAREVKAAPIRVTNGPGADHEKFIFYRGVGSPQLPLEVRFEENEIRVKNLVADTVKYIVFENDGRRSAYGVYAAVDEKNDLPVPRPLEGGIAWPDLDHRGALEKLLRQQGLFADEAKAMVATWEDDWFEPGLRVFWIVPQAEVDRILPLKIEPAPRRTVRAFVGRVEILTPEYRERVEMAARALVGGDGGPLDALGRFALPILEDIRAKAKDEKLSAAVALYIAKLRDRESRPEVETETR